MSRPSTSSRKHLLGQQIATPVSRRLSVRVPLLLSRLIETECKKAGVSRNRWFSETMVRFRQRQVVDRLGLPPRPDVDDEAEAARDAALSEDDNRWHVEEVNRALALLVKETFITTTGGVSLPIRFTDEGLRAVSDMLYRIDSVRNLAPEKAPDGSPLPRAVDLSHLTNVRTVLVHAALWDRLMEGKDIQEVAKLMASLDAPEAANAPDVGTATNAGTR